MVLSIASTIRHQRLAEGERVRELSISAAVRRKGIDEVASGKDLGWARRAKRVDYANSVTSSADKRRTDRLLRLAITITSCSANLGSLLTGVGRGLARLDQDAIWSDPGRCEVAAGIHSDGDDHDSGHQRDRHNLEMSCATGIQKRRTHRSLHAVMPRWAACYSGLVRRR